MHLTEEELNEYLDNEIQDRARAELHLSSCDECAARLATLQALFTEIESLPELALTRDLAAPVMRTVVGAGRSCRAAFPAPDSDPASRARCDRNHLRSTNCDAIFSSYLSRIQTPSLYRYIPANANAMDDLA